LAFIIRILHNARSSECRNLKQVTFVLLRYLCYIVRIMESGEAYTLSTSTKEYERSI